MFVGTSSPEASATSEISNSGRFMYRCEQCYTVVPAKTPALHLVTQQRPRSYPFREKANREIKRKGPDNHYRHDQGGLGWEVAESVKVCERCFSRAEERQAA